jgi:hypothetical protein
MSSWEITSFLGEYLKVQSSYNYNDPDNKIQKYININLNYETSFYPISLEDYNYMVNIYSSDNLSLNSEKSFVKINPIDEKLDIIKDSNILESISLKDLNNKIYETQKSK